MVHALHSYSVEIKRFGKLSLGESHSLLAKFILKVCYCQNKIKGESLGNCLELYKKDRIDIIVIYGYNYV